MPKITEVRVYSPYMLKLFADCPVKFYYKYINRLPSPIPDKNFEKGKNIHSIASYYLSGVNITKFENVLSSEEKDMWEYLKRCEYFNFELISVEKSISMKLDNYWIGGRIDAVFKNKNAYFILDYKTGRIKENMTYDVQTMIYSIMCKEVFSDAKSISFIYMDLKNKCDRKILLTTDLINEYKKIITSQIKEIENFDLSNYQAKQNCKCEYAKICFSNIG